MAKKDEKTGEDIVASTVGFTPEQMDLVTKMIEASKSTRNERGVVSRYSDVRDPKSITKVKVSRFDGKFVLGFKDLNTDPYRKAPKYCENKLDLLRKLPDQPFVTLLLSAGEDDEITEKEVSLITYMDNRSKEECDVDHIEETTFIDDKGLLGRYAGGPGVSVGAIDDMGKFTTPVQVKAEVKRVERVYFVKVPGFEKPVSFIEAFLA